ARAEAVAPVIFPCDVVHHKRHTVHAIQAIEADADVEVVGRSFIDPSLDTAAEGDFSLAAAHCFAVEDEQTGANCPVPRQFRHFIRLEPSASRTRNRHQPHSEQKPQCDAPENTQTFQCITSLWRTRGRNAVSESSQRRALFAHTLANYRRLLYPFLRR